VFAGQVMVALSFAELAGRYPVAGSVYNWSKRLAGPTVTAWLAGWMMFTASVVSLAAVALAYAAARSRRSGAGFQLVGDGTGDAGDAAVNGVLLGRDPRRAHHGRSTRSASS
jgi:amino acid transporter